MTFQKIRRLTLTLSMLLFPITIYYFSPYLILTAAWHHIINGSFIVFSLMFFFGMFFGRLWCGFFCPTGGLQECFASFSCGSPKQGWRNYLKYGIWFVWICGVIVCYALGKGGCTVQPFFMTERGISISDIRDYVIYYGIVLLFLIPSLAHGKRAGCHYFCWMAPFMVLGYKAGRAMHLPQLRIKAQKEKCTGCKKCGASCPMSLNVPELLERGEIRSAECILCGECVGACKRGLLKYTMTAKGSGK